MGSSPQSLRSPSPFPAFAYSRTKRHLLFFGGAGGSSSGGGSAGVAVRWAVFECADALRRGREKWRTSDSPAALVEARSPTVLLPLHCHALRRRWTAVFYETRGSFDPKVFGKRQYPPRSPIRFVIVPPFLTALCVDSARESTSLWTPDARRKEQKQGFRARGARRGKGGREARGARRLVALKKLSQPPPVALLERPCGDLSPF